MTRCLSAAAAAVLAAVIAGGPNGAQAMPFGLVDDGQLECLALNVYFEARSESLSGQLAIAYTTLNRVAAKGFPDTICDVVRQGGEHAKGRCQFSWWCDGRSDRVYDWKAWDAAVRVARRALKRRAEDPTSGALFFHLAGIKPGWARYHALTARIGKHLFYR
jgi:N-acetylmuramoyl-L-alanine amidase